jgi:thiol-disulfide isomerase/thioredoxin
MSMLTPRGRRHPASHTGGRTIFAASIARMDPLAGFVALVALPALATAAGLVWRARQGRVRAIAGPADAAHDASTAAELGLALDSLGARVTLVQFSTEFCSRCPATARELAAIADDYEGVRHVQIDLTRDAALADRFHVTQTPTTLVLDAGGNQTARIGGAPRVREVRSLLDSITRRTRVAS